MFMLDLLQLYFLFRAHQVQVLENLCLLPLDKADQEEEKKKLGDVFEGINREGECTYFFTKRERKFVDGRNTDRTTKDGRGHWKSTSKKNKVFAQDGSDLGKKTTLKYLVKNSTGDQEDIKTDWIMHEFVISNKLAFPSISSKDECYNDVAVCRIYKKKSETEELKNLINSLIGPNPFTTDHNNGEPQPSLKRKFKSNMETQITYDQTHDTTMNSNCLCDSNELEAALILDNMRTNYEIGQTSNTTSTTPEIGQTPPNVSFKKLLQFFGV